MRFIGIIFGLLHLTVRSVVIDNKDYNYTLIISGQDIQVIHHDTMKNLTYRHGLDVSLVLETGDGLSQ